MPNNKLPATTAPTREEFDQLVEQWPRVSRGQDVGEMVRHPAYDKIFALDEVAIPWILESLEAAGGHWFMSLHQITGAAPAPPESRGRVK